MRLVIIADDFTGALDVSVQFAPYDVIIKIAMGQSVDESAFTRGDADVLVVDAETRHLSAGAADAAVRRLVAMAVAADTQVIYLKTDSGLRGNVGATLTAALMESNRSFLAFAPAFPDMHRPTLGGVQYNEGVPIHLSPFGQDPFEPVRTSSVADLFEGREVRLRFYPRARTYDTAADAPTIGIFDAERNEDFRLIGEALKRDGRLALLAGCAAFASVLPALMGMRGRCVDRPLPEKPLLVLCGSLNPITRRQLRAAAAAGFRRITLTRSQQSTPGYLETDEGRRLTDSVRAALDGETGVILETEGIDEETLETLRMADEAGKQAVSRAAADRLGEILKRLLYEGPSDRFLPMIIGGDTLTGIMRQLPSPDITVEREIDPGVVMFSVAFAGRTVRMVSKSGGFGDERLLLRIAEAAKGRNGNGLHTANAPANVLGE
jgi:uncharacterized protein YgbK (DUF1537 family)